MSLRVRSKACRREGNRKGSALALGKQAVRRGRPRREEGAFTVELCILSGLRVLWLRLMDCGSAWAVTGSLGVALQGTDVEVHDIDLQTGREGASEIKGLLSDFVTAPVRFLTSESIRSYFGSFEVDGVRVGVMGDLQKSVDGAWEELVQVENYRRWVVVEGMRVPVLSLESECEAYRELGRVERILSKVQIVLGLQTHPELRRIAKEARQARSGVRGDTAPAERDLVDVLSILVPRQPFQMSRTGRASR